MTKLSTIAIIAVVLLRLLTGWHFFNEGVKKLDPNFTSAGFLRTARGPFAPIFRSMIPGPYGAHVDLARPIEYGSRSAEDQAAIDKWLADYARRADDAVKNAEPLPHDIDPAVPGSGWVGNIAKGWDQGLERLGRLGGDEDSAERLQALRDAKLGEIVYYLHGIFPSIEDLQHEEWRLTKLRDEGGVSPPAYLQLRIDEKADEIWKTMQPWIATVRQIENSFIEDAQAIEAEFDVRPRRVQDALGERSVVSRLDTAVACVVLGAGICVFLGLLTRVAAVLAACFLLSLILTQPPWIAGADMTAFFNWSIEMAAFLVLAAVGAGRWAGIDGLFYAARVRFGDLSPRYQRLPDRPASSAVA
ncbi:DoxX [Botrimarina colliarenosi]|uniref:DoxX n=1 Tax=Botrimarina colliarenosi TaxID=2528001 RepID=A0A5C6AKC8_9BACT|nr:DoxX family protein [Botrimarina colliarenosi]TWT99698.1 DoxX [Botrimarina colliarenosi]